MKRLFALAAVLTLVACSAPPPEPAKPEAPKEVPLTSKSSEALDHFKKGRDLADNLRGSEAAQEFDQALKADADFALALAYRGTVTPGPQGATDLEQANAKASSASEPEKLFIAAMLASRHGDVAKADQAC